MKRRWGRKLTCGLGIRSALAAAMVLSVVSAQPSQAHELAFYVGSHGWHTSIIVPRAHIAVCSWPAGVATRTFAGFEYLEIGWGDRKFYTAPKPNALMALDAVFLPGPSVLHIVGLHPPLARALPWSALVKVPCTARELADIGRALGDSFARNSSGRAIALGPGLYGETSRFYAAEGRYYFLNTCDTWTARVLRAGGLPAQRDLAHTWSAGAVIAQARRMVAARNAEGLN